MAPTTASEWPPQSVVRLHSAAFLLNTGSVQGGLKTDKGYAYDTSRWQNGTTPTLE